MTEIGFFDTKPYDRYWFDRTSDASLHFRYFENKLNAGTAKLAEGCGAVVAFVNDEIDRETVSILHGLGVRLVALRCAGYNNVDFAAAYGKLTVVRVPGYSPYAVAEHAMGLLLCLNRKLHRAYNRTREFNFNISGLTGFDLHGKTAGVVGTGRIGQVFIDICRGFGMRVLAYDLYPNQSLEVEYVPSETLLSQSDVLSLHCPLTEQTRHMVNADSLAQMKKGVVLINTSRGALIDSEALLGALQSGQVRAAGLDVYEEEGDLFFEDFSDEPNRDRILQLLVSLPNVIVTSHQAFLTDEALENIAVTTVGNIRAYFDGAPLENEICYRCQPGGRTADCRKATTGRCF